MAKNEITTLQRLLTKLELLRAEATAAGFELVGTILTAEESAITDAIRRLVRLSMQQS